MTVRLRSRRWSAIRGAAACAVLALVAAAMPATSLAAPVGSATPAAAPDSGDKIKPALAQQLEDKGEATFWVRFDATADLSAARQIEDWTERGQAVYDALTSTAEESQKQTLAVLTGEGARFQTFWATNAIRVKEGSQELAERLAADPAVAALYPTREYTLEKPTKGTDEHEVNAVEWGIANINADDVWDQYDLTGEGLVIANIDTGVQFDHPALVNKYRGNNGDGTFDHNYNWFNAAGTCATPCDPYGHGTHTMGTMIGDDGAGNQIGVAPGATWIAANGCCPNDAALIESGQWMLAPTDLAGQNPDASKRPNIINNSWGTNAASNDPFMEDISAAWTASGIFGVWANGNIGPACESSGAPGSRIINYSVGAYSVDNTIAGFSSRGAGQDGETKPNISAPGVNVRSSVPGSDYDSVSGTSMATPHVAGAIALLWSAAPALLGDVNATKALLNQTGVDSPDDQCGGTDDDNNVFGEGRLDALALLNAAPIGDTGRLEGTVTDAVTGDPIAGAKVTITGALERTLITGEDGTYGTLLTVGTYDVTADAFGFTSAAGVAEILDDQTTVLDFTPAPLPRHSVSGTVAEQAGSPVPGATVKLVGTPIEPAVTDESGQYVFNSVPEGSYSVTVSGGGCFDGLTADLVVDNPETLDVRLAERRDIFGHTCRPEAADYVEATDALPIEGDDLIEVVELPFSFPHYSAAYATAYVSSNGYVAFQLPGLTNFCEVPGCNVAIPNRGTPNAAIYAFWTDLYVDFTSAQVLTADLGDRFVIEWRNVHELGDPSTRVDAEIVLHDNGQIVLQYRNLDTHWDRGSTATVGIEDAYGTDAFQYSFNQAILSQDHAIRFARPPAGVLSGGITDLGDGLPISGVKITRTDARGTLQTASTNEDGTYTAPLPVGTWTVTFARRGFVTESREVTVNEAGQEIALDVALRPVASLRPDAIDEIVVQGEQRTVDVRLTNSGAASLEWEVQERGGTRAGTGSEQRRARDATSEPAILVFAEMYGPTPDSYVDDALQRLGLPYTGFYNGDHIADFMAALDQGGWDLVIIDTSTWTASMLDRLHDWVADGGKLIMYNDAIGSGFFPSHPLWAALGVEFVNRDRCPRNPVYFWEAAHPLFTAPESVPEFSEYPESDLCFEGLNQRVAVLPGARALAGYSENPDSRQAALVLANDDRTLFRGFFDNFNTNDLDGDGVNDAVELWTNSIVAIHHGFSEDVPWLTASPLAGRLDPGQTETLEVSLDTTGLAPGAYTASVAVNGVAGPDGTRLTIPVRLVVQENTAPAGGADEYSTAVGQELVVEAPGVLANDTDADGDTLTATGGSLPAHGEVVLSADGSFTYAPDAGFSGTDTFTYRASDGTAQSEPVAVTITVADDPDPVATKVSGTATSFRYGERGKVAVSVTPKAATGKVDVRKGSKLLATGTLSAGKVTVTLPARSLLPGQHLLTLRYRGDANHAASSATVKVTVRKAKPTLRYAVPTQVRVGQRATVTVRVLAPSGVPVSGVVRATFAGKTVSGWLRADDRVVLRLPKATRTGWFKVKLAYLGSSVLESAAKTPYIRVRR